MGVAKGGGGGLRFELNWDRSFCLKLIVHHLGPSERFRVEFKDNHYLAP